MMNQNIYDIRYDKLIRWEIPMPLREPIVIALLNAFSIPFVFVYQNLLRFRDTKRYQLSITSQVCYLEKMLNDKYDLDLRRIHITDGISKPAQYIYKEEEQKQVFMYQSDENVAVFIFKDEETELDVVDFVVNIPSDVSFNEAEMRSLIERYKLAGKSFSIKYS